MGLILVHEIQNWRATSGKRIPTTSYQIVFGCLFLHLRHPGTTKFENINKSKDN